MTWDAAERWLRETAKVFDADAAADALAAGTPPTYDIERALGVLGNRGLVEHRRGNLEMAAGLFERSLRFARAHGSVPNLGTLLIRYADVLVDLGRTKEALAALQEAKPIIERLRMHEEVEQYEKISRRVRFHERTQRVTLAWRHGSCGWHPLAGSTTVRGRNARPSRACCSAAGGVLVGETVVAVSAVEPVVVLLAGGRAGRRAGPGPAASAGMT
jgi:hypothetical protein